MERKKASDYPQELLDLFHEYQHGDITRRDFLDRAKKFAVGGMTTLALWESLKPNYAWAEQVPKDDKRIKVGYETVQSPEGNGSIKGYFARPASASGKLPQYSSFTRTADSIRTSKMSRAALRLPTSLRTRPTV